MAAPTSFARRLLLTSAKICVAILALPLCYLLAAAIGGVVPANWAWEQPEQGITIYVQTNGVHTWIVVPAVTPQMDWRPLMPIEHIREPGLGGDYLAIGYGNREFYLNTPAWKDLTIGRAVSAAVGNGPTLMHVYHEPQPVPGEDQRPITLSIEEYRRIVTFIESSFNRDESGRTIPLISRGYGRTDVFYEARGGYNLYYTCNEWSGSALREAGVRVGIWTPFSLSIMERF